MGLTLLLAVASLCFIVADPFLASWNERIFSRERGSQEAMERFRRAMARRAWYKTAALIFLVLSALSSIHSDRKESKMSEQNFQNIESSLQRTQEAMREVSGKVVKIEQFLWGGGGPETPPGKPGPRPGGGSGYATLEERMQAIEQAQTDLRLGVATKDDIEKIQKEIIKLRAALRRYEQLMQQIRAAPAG